MDGNRKGVAMAKLFLVLLLALACNSAMAEWVGIGRAKDGIGKFYANSSSVQRVGSKVKLWALTDFSKTQKTPNGLKSYRSYKLRLEIDCKQSEIRNLGFIVYTENMGKGEIVLSSERAFESEPIQKSSILEVMSEYACKKK